MIAEVEAGLTEAMADFNNAEAVKKVKVLGDEWLPDTELLTPTSKLKRRGILLSTFDGRDRGAVRQGEPVPARPSLTFRRCWVQAMSR